MIKITKRFIILSNDDGAVLEQEYYRDGDSITFDWTAMYEPPVVTLAFLSELSQAFGTTDIDVARGIHERGCDTCDYGSIYGHTISIRNITRWPNGADQDNGTQ